MSGHVCGPTCLPLCKFAQAGSGGIGRPKPHPSTPGRDARERAHAAAHPRCQCAGGRTCANPRKHTFQPCRAQGQVIHHEGGRGMGGEKRRTARLQHLCIECDGSFAGTHTHGAR